MIWLGLALLAWCVFSVAFVIWLATREVRRARQLAAQRPRAIPMPTAGRTYLSWNATRPRHHGPRPGAR